MKKTLRIFIIFVSVQLYNGIYLITPGMSSLRLTLKVIEERNLKGFLNGPISSAWLCFWVPVLTWTFFIATFLYFWFGWLPQTHLTPIHGSGAITFSCSSDCNATTGFCAVRPFGPIAPITLHWNNYCQFLWRRCPVPRPKKWVPQDKFLGSFRKLVPDNPMNQKCSMNKVTEDLQIWVFFVH